MLSNNDFKEKFLTPSAGDKSKNDKAWEMKQIRAWDQQVKAKSGTSVGTKKGPPGRPVVQEDIKEAASSEYRDRAAERRSDANPDYASAELEQAANLDIEYSKFLGGDSEHTHLVKGLDYLLLQKMKQDAKETVAALAASDGNRSAMGVLKPLEEISTNTPLGARLKALMLNGSVRCRGRSAKATGMLACARTAYEFDVDIMSEIDIPTIISKSIKDSIDTAERLTCPMHPELLTQISEAFRPGKTKPKIKKLEKDIETPKVAPVTKLVVDAVGDIFADAGKYTPQIDTVRTPAVSNEGTNKTSYFKSAVTENTEEETRSRASVMATVKALMQTQGGVARVATETRKRVFDDATGEADEGRQLVIEETGKVHRDIIGGTIGHIGGEFDAINRGDVSMARGTYDLYPETGDYETFDSDEDNEGGGTTVKTAGKKGVGGNKMSRSERRAAKRLKV